MVMFVVLYTLSEDYSSNNKQSVVKKMNEYLDKYSDNIEFVGDILYRGISDKGKYDYIKKKFYPFDGVEVDDDYIHKMNNIVNTKFQVSKTILQKDYYSKVLGE